MFGLLALCTCACILLVVVIVHSGGHFDFKKLLRHSTVVTTSAADSRAENDTIPIPERFKEVGNNPTTDTTTAAETIPEPPQEPARPNPVQKYFSTFPCSQLISGTDLKLLFADNNIFCQKSRWSATWANPAGKGLRRKREGLLIRDSVVIDSFTNLMWQRFAPGKMLPYGKTVSAVEVLNSEHWQGYSDWRLPKIEEIMATFIPQKNKNGLYLPPGWNCKAPDIWSCNASADSLGTRWIWVARTALGRCNYGHPDTARSLLAVRGL